MAKPRKLCEEEIQAALDKLTGWSLKEGKLHRVFDFADFVSAFGFMSSCALHAERLGHHPEWFNVYKRVRVDLHTHDIAGLSDLDVELATRMSELAARASR